MSQFHAARFRSVGSGEGALFVSEELAFEQRPRNGGTVDFDKGTIPPRRKPVNHASDDVLTGTALALNQDGNVGAGDFVHAVAQRLHDLRVAENYGLGRKLSQ